jgi:tetratricopeptide (TPR) repeat protein
MARFGLLYLNKGTWNGRRILSQAWIAESTRAHSDDAWFGGYGYMWWVYLDEPFGSLKMYSALGVGEQSIDVIPGANMVVVVRTDTFAGKSVSQSERLDLIKKILEARTSEPKPTPRLVPLPAVPRPFEAVQLSPEQKKALCAMPADPSTGRIDMDGEDLVLKAGTATFGLIATKGDRLIVDDTYEELHLERGADGSILRLITESSLNTEGYRLLQSGETSKAVEVFKRAVKYYPDSFNAYDSLGEAYMTDGARELAIANYRKSLELNPRNTNAVEMLDRLGYSWAGPDGESLLPDTVAGRRAMAFFETFNSGDEERIRAFEAEHRAKSASKNRSIEERVAQLLELKKALGTLTPLMILTNEEHVLTVLTKASRNGLVFEFRFELEEEPPFGIAAVRITGAGG